MHPEEVTHAGGADPWILFFIVLISVLLGWAVGEVVESIKRKRGTK